MSMMGLLSTFTGTASPKDTKDRAPEGSDPNDTEILDDEPRNMLLALMSQLRVGMDLSKVTLPTFVLEPRSMLERVTDFMSHPELVFGAGANDDPNERFIHVLRYYLAGWHIKPKGVKKPYNPVLGEFFRCRYDYKDGTVGYYIAEQVSHHPPISAFAFFSPDNNLLIYGELRPKSKFLGNSAATIMEGTSKIILLDRPEDGIYEISMPNTYARGILFGKMVLELGDQSFVKNEKNGIGCDVEFKTKGFFSGTYNAIAGNITSNQKDIGEISGKWSDVMEIQRPNGKKETLFDAHNADLTPKTVTDESEQEELESRRLWTDVTDAIVKGDQDAATEAKTKIEEAQRERARSREASGTEFSPRFFYLENNEYKPKIKDIPSDKQEANELVENFIYKDQPRPAKQ